MKRICYLFKEGRKRRLFSKERFPLEFFYGYFYLKEKGVEVDIIEESEILNGRKSIILELFLKMPVKIPEIIFSFFGFNIRFLLGFLTKGVFKKLNNYDVIIATTNSFGLALSLLKCLGLVKTKILFIAMGILEKHTFFLKKLFYNFLFKGVILCSLGEGEAGCLSNCFFLFNSTVYYIPFGIDATFWMPLSDRHRDAAQPYFISIGNDRHRDYETLIKAWSHKFPPLKIVTQRRVFEDRESKSYNIEALEGKWSGGSYSDNEVKRMIQDSLGVVVPLKETLQPSGQSVSLQAMACARPLILTETSGLWGGKHLKHKFNCYLIKPKNTSDLRGAVQWILKNRDAANAMGIHARETVLEHFTILRFNKNFYLALMSM